MDGLTVAVGLMMFVGFVGIVVPVLPGLLVVWGAVLLWASMVQATAGWVVLGFAKTIAPPVFLLQFRLPRRPQRHAGGRGQALAKAKAIPGPVAQTTPLTYWQITDVLPRVNDLSHDDGLFMEYLNSSMQRPPESAQRLRDFVEKRATPLQAPGKKA